MKDNLSRYISLNEKIYQGFELQLYFDSFSDDYVQRKINKLLFDNRTKEYNGANVLNLPITLGDDAYIYYNDGSNEEAHQDENIVDVKGGKDYWGFQHIRQIRQFYNAVLKKEPLDISGEEALKTHRLIMEIYKIGKAGMI